MRRWSILLLGPLFAAAIYACGGAATPAATASGDTCPADTSTSPPTCPAGCKWNGTECRKQEGIIMDDAKADAGAPPPTK